jgi:trans-2,3-dihydro-3-hydroxyanthranilate isomerase
MQRHYVTLDVFTDRAFGGNPLAVVFDAAGLSPAQMQAVAREFNYFETTFVLPPDDPAHTARVRIFTPTYELPFAGHPNVGTAVAIARGMAAPPARVVFEELAGLVPLEIDIVDGKAVGAELTAPQALQRGPGPAAAAIAAAAGLSVADLRASAHPPTVAGVGVEFVFAEVADRAALGRVQPDAAKLAAVMGSAVGLFLYTRDADPAEADMQARMFGLVPGVTEDPATGSACVALAALLADIDPMSDGERVLRIAQGLEMGRPSLLRTRAVKRGGALVSAHIGGGCVEMMRGTFVLAGTA